jgi:hypothetical protein
MDVDKAEHITVPMNPGNENRIHLCVKEKLRLGADAKCFTNEEHLALISVH